MIDRWGKRIIVGWAEHEILWVKAAIKLPRDERIEAFQDIASMTGRTEFAVRDKAKDIRAQQRKDMELIFTAAPCPPRRIATPYAFEAKRALPSQFAPPSIARLMGGR